MHLFLPFWEDSRRFHHVSQNSSTNPGCKFSHLFGCWLWSDCKSFNVIRRGWALQQGQPFQRMGGIAHSGGLGDQFTPQQQHLFTCESLPVATGRTCLSVPFQGILSVDYMEGHCRSSNLLHWGSWNGTAMPRAQSPKRGTPQVCLFLM